MTPLKLTLENFTGIRSGLNRDILELNIGELIAGHDLVALKGDNGAGKSTILDSLTPYRILASRASSYSPNAFSYYDNTYGTQAKKELDWEHRGITYRSIILLKNSGKTKKTEAYLQVLAGSDNWSPFYMEDGTPSDGKTANYDRCVESIIGSPELFFTAAFACQGRATLATYTNGEIKELLAELLNLAHVLNLGKQANEVLKIFHTRLDAYQNDLASIVTKKTELDTAEMQRDSLKSNLSLLDTARRQGREAVEAANKKVAMAEATATTGADIEAKRKELAERVGQIADDAQRQADDTQKNIDHERTQQKQNSGRHDQEITAINSNLITHQQQLAKDEELLSKKEEIENASTTAEALAHKGEELQNKTKELRPLANQHLESINHRDVTREKLNTAINNGKSLKGNIEQLNIRAKLIDEVPCHDTDYQTQCPLLAEANEAKKGIPLLENNCTTSREQCESLKEKGKKFGDKVTELEPYVVELQEVEKELAITVEKSQALANTAKLAPLVERAVESAEQQRQLIKDCKTSMNSKTEALATTDIEITKRIAASTNRITEIKEEARKRIEPIQKELDSLPPQEREGIVEKAKRELSEAEHGRDQAEHNYDESYTKSANLDALINSIKNWLLKSSTIASKTELIESEIASWTLLVKALGANGIVALSIDDAGPDISRITNDLLLACYGPRFTVRIETQSETAKGDLRETFDIVVFDAERDDEKSIGDMSGGEKIWINEALTRAIALYQASVSGQNYKVLFSDESDGALDPERKQMFLTMKRKVLEIGNYSNEIFISHTPDVIDSADKIIDLNELRVA